MRLKLKQDFQRLMKEKIPNYQEVIQLKDNVTFQVLPFSWKSEVNICFYYYARDKSGSHHCKPDKDGHSEYLCAPVNKLTPDYTDTKRGRANGACMKSWSINGPSLSALSDEDQYSWFKRMKLCFRYRSEKNI